MSEQLLGDWYVAADCLEKNVEERNALGFRSMIWADDRPRTASKRIFLYRYLLGVVAGDRN